MVASKDLPPFTGSFLRVFWHAQFRVKEQWPPRNTNLSSKVAIVTGANTGIGFEAARQLLSFKLSRIVLAVRSIEKGEAAAKRLRSDYPTATVEVWPLDMNSYDSVQAFATRTQTELSRLDFAILNAGLSKLKMSIVPGTGHEEMVQVNYLSTMLLGILLLPILKHKSPAGVPGRLTIIGSATAFTAKFPKSTPALLLPMVDDPKNFKLGNQYGVSKLLGFMFFYRLIDHVDANDVVVNILEPGFVKGSQLQRDVSGVLSIVLAVMNAVTARTVQHGATTYLDAAIVKGRGSHGCYLADYEIRAFPRLLYTAEGKETMEKLWQETTKELEFARIQSILDSMKKG